MSVVFLTAKCAKIAKSFYDLFLCVRVYRVLRGSRNLKGVFIAILTAKSFSGLFFSCSRRLRCSRFKKFKGSVHCNFHRESSYDLFPLVRTVRVVRGSSF